MIPLADSVAFEHVLGMRVVWNPLCLQDTKEPARPYRRRRWQTAAQAARKAKKWLKRWGTKRVPCMFIVDGAMILPPALRAAGVPMSKTLVAHPDLKKQLDALFRESIIEKYRTMPLNPAIYA